VNRREKRIFKKKVFCSPDKRSAKSKRGDPSTKGRFSGEDNQVKKKRGLQDPHTEKKKTTRGGYRNVPCTGLGRGEDSGKVSSHEEGKKGTQVIPRGGNAREKRSSSAVDAEMKRRGSRWGGPGNAVNRLEY